MAFELTNAQKDAVNANGTVLVSAAAGSGKTAVLVERLMQRFCSRDNTLMANRALIVTFTNAAAAELKLKIETNLKKKLAKNPQSDLLRRQNILIKSAKISTIDSFCISIVKENFNLLNISNDFRTVSNNEIEEDIIDLLNTIFKEKHNSKDEDFLKLLDALQDGYDDSYLKKIVLTLYKKSCSMPYPHKWLNEIVDMYLKSVENINESPWVKMLCNTLSYTASEALQLSSELLELSKTAPEFFDKYALELNNRKEFASKLLEILKESDIEKLINVVNEHKSDGLKTNSIKDNPKISALIKRSKDAENELVKGIKTSFGTNAKVHKQTFKSLSEIVLRIAKLVNEFIERIYENSVKNNLFTYDQIAHMALRLCTEFDSIVTENFKQNYDVILVDEYQDTNNLQDEIFSVLGKKTRQLFMVGDVKQSIYGFRDANPDNFLQKKDSYLEYNGTDGKSKVLLSGNFRSRKEICNFINYIFKAYMTKAGADMDYDSGEELIPLADYPNNNESAVEIFLTEATENQNKTISEANLIVDYIEKTLKKEPFLSDGNGGLRKATLDDIVILMRSPNSKIKDYSNVFNARGIPLSVPADSFKSAMEIIDALALLKTVDNFNDNISLATVLKSPMFCFSDEEIAKIRIKNKYVPLYLNLKESGKNGFKKAKSAYEFLSKATKLSSVLSVDKLLSKLFTESGFIEVYGALPQGKIRIANIRTLIEMAASHSYGDNGIAEFVKYIESDANTAVSNNFVSSESSVKIISIHKSKGLQYPICIVSSLANDFNKEDLKKKILFDDKAGIGFDYFDEHYNSVITPLSFTAVKSSANEKIHKEELRLLYVAMTRACEKLVLVASVKDKSKFLEKASQNAYDISNGSLPFSDRAIHKSSNYAMWIFSAVLAHKGGETLRTATLPIKTVEYDCDFMLKISDGEELLLNSKKDATDEIKFDFGDRFNYKYPYIELNRVPAKTSVTDILSEKSSAELVFDRVPGFMLESGITAAEKGTATHKFMEYCDYGAAADDIEAEIERLYEWQYISRAEADMIDKDSLKAFFEGYAYGLMLKAKNIYKEYHFLTELDLTDYLDIGPTQISEPSIVQGVADCIIENSEDIIIIDYKTDKISDEKKLIERYSKQLKLYSEAIGKIFSKPVSKKIIYSFHLKRCIEV